MAVELVFIHGWGFDARFWDNLCALMPQFRHSRIDLGFFGAAPQAHDSKSSKRVLVGHSLGFVHGLKYYKNWHGWIAINGFTRFIDGAGRPGCLPVARLRALKIGLQNDAKKTLDDFYALIGAPPPRAAPNGERLREGLDELQAADAEDFLEESRLPGLVLAGRCDPLVPLAASETLVHKARQGRLHLHEEAGHLLPLSDPAWCAQAMAGFLADCFADT
jgi:pimeloyl-[acyl-carrier protein] methyl ester esterase